jgi:rhodanese-related sulfurtransferase
MSGTAVPDEISAVDLLAELRRSNGELALLDVREEGRFAKGHILRATSLPLSRLELHISSLVPRRTCRVILCDDNDGLSQTAAARLRGLGYSNVVTIRHGLTGWVAAGGEVFQGLNVPSKALGAFAQRALAIPEIEPEQLVRLLKSEPSPNLIDCRPFAEYQRGCIPGAVNCPGVELLRHMKQLDADMTVINCAGRTRGLLGAQTMIDFGFARTVVALKDGTMGWELAGYDVERTTSRRLNNAAGVQPILREVANGIRRQAGIALLDLDTLTRWCADPSRTAYVFDIREASECQAGRIAQVRHVAGGQLIQNFDQHVATLGSRVVLADDDGVRATAVALWLRRMGWREVAVVSGSDASKLMDGPSVRPIAIRPPDVATVNAQELNSLLERGDVLLIDLATSREYKDGHIPGAWFVVRSRLANVLPLLPKTETIVLTSEDGAVAAFASRDDIPCNGPVRVLEGGTASWRRAGYPLSKSLERVANAMDDVVLKPSELSEGRESAIRDYLSGSERLLDMVQRDGTLHLTALPVR